MTPELEKVTVLAAAIGARQDYFQGGGGNVSWKFDDRTMLIKASGIRVADITGSENLVLMNYARIKDFYRARGKALDREDLQRENDAFAASALVSHKAYASRPSMEFGFHSLLALATIHSHSVYANLLNCTREGTLLLKQLFPDALQIPYHTPGALLTQALQNAGATLNTSVIFLENHGLIVSASSSTDAILLHEAVNSKIRDQLGLTSPYPIASVKARNKGFVSDSPYVSAFIRKNPNIVQQFPALMLFPDQAVYGHAVTFSNSVTSPIAIDIDSGTIHYTESHAKALAFEETFLAWAFVVTEAKRLGFTLKSLSESECAFITDMESERYRTSVL